MKMIWNRFLVLGVALMVAMGFGGCATHSSTAGHACGKCGCQHMEVDAAHPGKCKMCGHDAAAHDASGAPKEGAQHVH